jgi:hypothetical protein
VLTTPVSQPHGVRLLQALHRVCGEVPKPAGASRTLTEPCGRSTLRCFREQSILIGRSVDGPNRDAQRLPGQQGRRRELQSCRMALGVMCSKRSRRRRRRVPGPVRRRAPNRILKSLDNQNSHQAGRGQERRRARHRRYPSGRRRRLYLGSADRDELRVDVRVPMNTKSRLPSIRPGEERL